jgi:hypothetical protein
MSLSMSGMSSQSSDSASTSSIPKIPNDRALWDNWSMHMRAYLDDKGVLNVVIPADVVGSSLTGKGKDDGSDASSSSSSSSSDSELDVSKLRKKAWLILLQSFSKPTHYDHARQVHDSDPAKLWKRLASAYGMVKTAETVAALYNQIQSLLIHRKEHMEAYIVRADKIMFDLNLAGSPIPRAGRKMHILQGLRHLPEWTTVMMSLIKHSSQMTTREE